MTTGGEGSFLEIHASSWKQGKKKGGGGGQEKGRKSQRSWDGSPGWGKGNREIQAIRGTECSEKNIRVGKKG